MDLNCRRCHKPIAVENINIQQMIAKCGGCGAVFTFGPADASRETHSPGGTKATVPRPGSWQVAREGNQLVLTRKWFKPLFLFLLLFSFVWNSFLVGWYSLLGGIGGEAGFSAFSLIFFIFPLGHVAVGLGLAYYTLAGLLNRTIITVDRSALSIKHRPLPWRHSGVIAAHELDQLYCKEERQSNKGSSWYTYSVSALLRDGRERKIMSGLDSPEEALYLESEVERYLGITDRPVAGEYRV